MKGGGSREGVKEYYGGRGVATHSSLTVSMSVALSAGQEMAVASGQEKSDATR